MPGCLCRDSVSSDFGQQDDASYIITRIKGDVNGAVLLPYEVNADKVEAVLQKGVLTVTLPKTAATVLPLSS
jgi:HSP20 family molecular chaperone IbpA